MHHCDPLTLSDRPAARRTKSRGPEKSKCVVDRGQVVEVRRLRELHEGQAVTGVVRVQEIAREREQLAAVLGLPVSLRR